MVDKPGQGQPEAGQQGRQRVRLVWLVAGLAIVGLGALLTFALNGSGDLPGLIRYEGVSRGHDDDVSYAQEDRPPAGGVHRDLWLNCGIYNTEVETGLAVHSLEHGAVWITYRPDLPAAEVEALQERVRNESYVLLSPYRGQESPIILTAWAVQLEVPRARDERIDDFIDRFRLGPTTPERGASCTGGVGEPMVRDEGPAGARKEP